MKLNSSLGFCLAVFSLFAISCGQSASTGRSDSSSEQRSSPTSTLVEKTTVSLTTPTNAYKSRLEALKNHDEEALRQTFSAGYLRLYEEILPKGQLIGDAMRENFRKQGANFELPENASETIEGNRARTQYTDSNGTIVTTKFIREGNDWKVALEPEYNAIAATPQ